MEKSNYWSQLGHTLRPNNNIIWYISQIMILLCPNDKCFKMNDNYIQMISRMICFTNNDMSEWYRELYVSQKMICPNNMFHKKWYVRSISRVICFTFFFSDVWFHHNLFGRDYKDFLVEKLGYVYLGLQNVKNFGKISVILGFSWLQ